MKTSSKILIVIASIAVAFLHCGCKSTNSVGDCGPVYQVTLDTTLTVYGNTFKLQTGPGANASQFCEATFNFNFHWADPNRAYYDTTMPPLNDLKGAFHVNSDNLTFLNDTPNPTHSFVLARNVWSIVFSDHDAAGDTTGANFYVKTFLNSNQLADSVRVTASISYYKAQQ